LLLLLFSGEVIAYLFFFSILFLEQLQVSQLCFFIFDSCLLSLLLSEYVLHGLLCLLLLLDWHGCCLLCVLVLLTYLAILFCVRGYLLLIASMQVSPSSSLSRRIAVPDIGYFDFAFDDLDFFMHYYILCLGGLFQLQQSCFLGESLSFLGLLLPSLFFDNLFLLFFEFFDVSLVFSGPFLGLFFLLKLLMISQLSLQGLILHLFALDSALLCLLSLLPKYIRPQGSNSQLFQLLFQVTFRRRLAGCLIIQSVIFFLLRRTYAFSHFNLDLSILGFQLLFARAATFLHDS
jgi:hypothetical protein